MSDCFEAIVDRDVTAREAPAKANTIRDWLIERRIIDSKASKCVLDPDALGYPPGQGYEQAVRTPSDLTGRLAVNGVSIIVGPEVTLDFEGEKLMICSGCGARSEATDECFEGIGLWLDGKADVQIACPCCGYRRPINQWDFEPPWGFGYLTIKFWNWPVLKKSFISEVSNILGDRTMLIHGRI